MEQVLVDKLYDIVDDEEFVTGVMSQVRHPMDQKALLNFIEYGKNVSLETVALYALELSIKRSNQ